MSGLTNHLDLCWDPVVVADAAGRITYWNRGAERTYGWASAEALGQFVPHLFQSEGDAPWEELNALSAEEGFWEGELRRRRKDGLRIYVFSRCTLLRDSDGNPTGRLEFSRDITRRRQAEMALRREREFSGRLIESSLDAISIFDVSYRYTVWNRAMEELTGVARSEAVGLSAFQVLPFLKEIGEESCFKAALAGKSVSSVNRPFWVASTQRRGVFEARYSPIRADAGLAEGGKSVVGGLVLMRDVTERVKNEESLRKLSGRLLQIRDDERRRIARELHDGTTQVITGITMNLATLRRIGLPGKAAAILRESAEMADRAVQELRTTSYLLHPPELDLIGLSGAVRSYVKGFEQRTGIHTDVEISESLGRLSQEVETALFRVVQEALANVHRHSGSPRAKVRLTREGDRVIEEIRDFGRGISSDTNGPGSATPGVGIAGMHIRVRQLGGELQIAPSAPGTLVRGIVPLAPAAPRTERNAPVFTALSRS
jgi:PAS domain S-box-containing protein